MYDLYWPQNVSQQSCEQEFIKLLKVWETEVRHYEHKVWYSDLIDKWSVKWNTEIALSKWCAHAQVSHSLVEESTQNSPLFSMILKWEWYITRSMWRDGTNIITKQSNLLYADNVISKIFKSDFEYLLEKKETYITEESRYEISYPGRPNRKQEHDGNNSLKDRYFSYFVWFIIQEHTTGNEFFDLYFVELQKRFHTWFKSLPKDSDLPEYKYPLRSEFWSYYNKITTQEDVLYLIAQYNITHSETPVDVSELL